MRRECVCGKMPGKKDWHVALNAMLLRCTLEAGAWSVVTDSSTLLTTAQLPKGQRGNV